MMKIPRNRTENCLIFLLVKRKKKLANDILVIMSNHSAPQTRADVTRK